MEINFFTIVFILLIAATGWFIGTYNSLQSKKQDIVEHASNIQIVLQKRMDLSQRIIDIAKSYGDHEKLTHLQVSQNTTGDAKSLAALAQAFPELKANDTYQKLMGQLETFENEILGKRELYNAVVKTYNTARSSFPAVLIAGKLNFGIIKYFDSQNPEALEEIVSFSSDDGQALKALISNGSQTISSSTKSIVNTASSTAKSAADSAIDTLVEVKSSETFQNAAQIAKERIEDIKQAESVQNINSTVQAALTPKNKTHEKGEIEHDTNEITSSN